MIPITIDATTKQAEPAAYVVYVDSFSHGVYGQPAPTAPAASVEGKMIEELLRKLAADFDKTLTGQSILESDGTMPLIQPKSKARLSMSLTWRGRARPMPLPPLPQD